MHTHIQTMFADFTTRLLKQCTRTLTWRTIVRTRAANLKPTKRHLCVSALSWGQPRRRNQEAKPLQQKAIQLHEVVGHCRGQDLKRTVRKKKKGWCVACWSWAGRGRDTVWPANQWTWVAWAWWRRCLFASRGHPRDEGCPSGAPHSRRDIATTGTRRVSRGKRKQPAKAIPFVIIKAETSCWSDPQQACRGTDRLWQSPWTRQRLYLLLLWIWNFERTGSVWVPILVQWKNPKVHSSWVLRSNSCRRQTSVNWLFDQLLRVSSRAKGYSKSCGSFAPGQLVFEHTAFNARDVNCLRFLIAQCCQAVENWSFLRRDCVP